MKHEGAKNKQGSPNLRDFVIHRVTTSRSGDNLHPHPSSIIMNIARFQFRLTPSIVRQAESLWRCLSTNAHHLAYYLAQDGIGPFHNLQTELVGFSQRKDSLDRFSCVSPIRPNELDAQVGVPDQSEKHSSTVAILDVGSMNHYSNNQSKRVYRRCRLQLLTFLPASYPWSPLFRSS